MGAPLNDPKVLKAIKWINEEKANNPDRNIAMLIDEAGGKFGLSPLQSDFLTTNFAPKNQPQPR